MRPPLRFAVLGLTVLVGLVATVLMTGRGADAAAYRYWSYYHWTGDSWQFADTGPEQFVPEDGSVEGWRFLLAGETGDARTPRAPGDFDQICGSSQAGSGEKRVAVVLDYGVEVDAPEGETPPEPRGACAVVATAATGGQVLSAVAEVRAGDGLVCAIDGYPEFECAATVDIAAPPPAGSEEAVALQLPAAAIAAAPLPSEDDGMSTGTLIVVGAGVLLVAGLGGLAFARSRRQNA
jgi:hypothetical protein